MDRGVQYGDGVFTTIAVRGGVPLFVDRHLQRLHNDCVRLGIDPSGLGHFHVDLAQLLSDSCNGVLKLMVTRGVSARGYAASPGTPPTRIALWFPGSLSPARSPARVGLCRLRLGRNPVLAGVKHLNRLEQVLARQEFVPTWQEGLMLDDEGNIVEAVSANIFWVADRILFTPLLDRCGVAGVMRAVVLELAQQLVIPTQVVRTPWNLLPVVDEAFLTSSLAGIWPVAELVERRLDCGPITARLCAAVAALEQQPLKTA